MKQTYTQSLVPRVFEGFPVAESNARRWRILLKQNMLLLPVRDAIEYVSPRRRGDSMQWAGGAIRCKYHR